MNIINIELSDNKKYVSYIREYDAKIYTPKQIFSVIVTIEDTPIGQDINIEFLEDCSYPLLDAIKSIKQYVQKNKL